MRPSTHSSGGGASPEHAPLGTAVAIAALITAIPAAGQAQAAPTAPADTAPAVHFGAFVDGYYAWDFGRPPSFDRSFAGGTPFTTQPARHNEFNVNLAFVEATLAHARYRGRLALQAGTSVQSNYAGEPATGTVSGPTLSRIVQEAVAGVRLAPGVWVDGGVFFSHVGMEGWVSRDNPTYTRSLVAEYSPYYQSGVKLTWTPDERVTAQLDLVNGWQNVAENNSGKGAGVRVDYKAGPAATLSYYNLFSNEAGSRLRTFNGVGARVGAGPLTVLAQLDVGTQARAAGAGGHASWYGWTAVVRRQLAPAAAVALRVEGYEDRSQIIVATGARDSAGAAPNPPLRALGASAGVDVTPAPRVLWRTELRGWRNRDALFPDGAGRGSRATSAVIVSSLALTF